MRNILFILTSVCVFMLVANFVYYSSQIDLQSDKATLVSDHLQDTTQRIKEALDNAIDHNLQEIWREEQKKQDKILNAKRLKAFMTEEILLFWYSWIEKENVDIPQKRLGQLLQWAKWFSEAIYKYQNQETSLGGMLPKGDAHLYMAMLAIQETRLNPRAKGASHGEVGIVQLHGVALNGYRKKEVRYNTKLGIDLGTRWMAIQFAKQHCPKRHTGVYTDKDWGRALSHYGAGPRAKSGKRCIMYRFARERVRMVQKYRKIIRNLD